MIFEYRPSVHTVCAYVMNFVAILMIAPIGIAIMAASLIFGACHKRSALVLLLTMVVFGASHLLVQSHIAPVL